MTEQPQFDVFLAHNNQDKLDVEKIANKLRDRGLKPWLDKEQILAGEFFQDVIQEAILKVKSAAIFISMKGLGRFQRLELRTFISQCVERDIPVIPVLLPGVDQVPDELLFLRQLNWVSFRSLDDSTALNNLHWGIIAKRLLIDDNEDTVKIEKLISIEDSAGENIQSPGPKPSLQNWGYLHTLKGHSDSVNSVAISPNGQILVSGSSDKTIKTWNLLTMQLIRTLPKGRTSVNSVAISSDNETFVSGSEGGTLKIWKLHSDDPLYTVTNAHEEEIESLAISPNGQILVSGSSDKTIKIWDLYTGKLRHTLSKGQSSVYAVAIGSDNKTLVSGSKGGTFKTWNLNTSQQLHTMDRAHSFGINSLTISSDMQTLATGSFDRKIRIWRSQ